MHTLSYMVDYTHSSALNPGQRSQASSLSCTVVDARLQNMPLKLMPPPHLEILNNLFGTATPKPRKPLNALNPLSPQILALAPKALKQLLLFSILGPLCIASSKPSPVVTPAQLPMHPETTQTRGTYDVSTNTPELKESCCQFCWSMKR